MIASAWSLFKRLALTVFGEIESTGGEIVSMLPPHNKARKAREREDILKSCNIMPKAEEAQHFFEAAGAPVNVQAVFVHWGGAAERQVALRKLKELRLIAAKRKLDAGGSAISRAIHAASRNDTSAISKTTGVRTKAPAFSTRGQPNEDAAAEVPQNGGLANQLPTPPSSHDNSGLAAVKSLTCWPEYQGKLYDRMTVLGHGGNGKVFLLSDDDKPSQKLVCKVVSGSAVIHKRYKRDREKNPFKSLKLQEEVELCRLDILREYHFLNTHAHERIMQVFSYQEVGSNYQIYMPYCDSGDLSTLTLYYQQVLRQRVPEDLIWHIFIQLSEGLSYLHHGYDKTKNPPSHLSRNWRSYIHADLKPSNIFLRSNPYHPKSYPNLVIGDFGTVRDEPGNKGYAIGTTCFQPPEMPEYSTQSDIWALGAIIHALGHHNAPPIAVEWDEEWAEKLVRAGKTDDQIWESWCEEPRARQVYALTKYSYMLDRLMRACLETEKERRPTAYACMIDTVWASGLRGVGWREEDVLGAAEYEYLLQVGDARLRHH